MDRICFLRLIAVCTALITCIGCRGAPSSVETDAVLKRLQTEYPSAQVIAVKKTPINGIFEVSVGGRIIHSDASGRYVLMGELHDMQSTQLSSLTEKSASNVSPAVISDEQLLALSNATARNAITYVQGEGGPDLYLFSDPKCPYCSQLEAELDKLDNVKIHKFPYPILSTESRRISKDAWCSPNRAVAWSRAMAGLPIKASADCKTPFDANIQFGKALAVRGTPTLITGEGRVLVGYHSADSLKQMLNLSGAKK